MRFGFWFLTPFLPLKVYVWISVSGPDSRVLSSVGDDSWSRVCMELDGELTPDCGRGCVPCIKAPQTARVCGRTRTTQDVVAD